MSRDGHYGTLRTLDGGYGVRVLDIDAFRNWQHHDKAVATREKFGGYPQTEYEVLWGVTAYEENVPDSPALRKTHATYLIPKCHIGRDGFASFWGRISEFTEPFWMWHAPHVGFVEPWKLVEDDLDDYALYCVLSMEGEVEWVEVPVGAAGGSAEG